LCKLTSNSTQDAVLILFLYIFIFEMNLGMLLTSQGKVPLALDESKENLNMAQTGERLQNGDEAHKKINLLLIIGEKPNREEKVEGLGRSMSSLSHLLRHHPLHLRHRLPHLPLHLHHPPHLCPLTPLHPHHPHRHPLHHPPCQEPGSTAGGWARCHP